MTQSTIPARPAHKPRPMIDLLVSLVLPSVILMKLSGEADLGPDRALILALAFPFCWGAFELIKYRKFNFIALLGLISILFTGGIGLLQLDSGWLAIKEAAIPGLIGLVVLGSTQTRHSLIRTLLLNNTLLNADLINTRLQASGNTHLFEEHLLRATYWLSSTFFFSSAMNYVLAKWIVVSPAGSEAFNAELGRMNLLSYPMIAIPSMLMLMAIFYYLWRHISSLTGLKLDEVMHDPNKDKQA
jgi:intracellular septation protein A